MVKIYSARVRRSTVPRQWVLEVYPDLPVIMKTGIGFSVTERQT